MTNGTRKNDERAAREAIAAIATLPVDLDAIGSRLAAEAEREGLVEVAWTLADSPIGELLLAATDDGLIRVGYPNQDADELLGELAVKVGPRVLEAPARLDDARRQLEQYFEGERREFELPIDWRLSRGFRREVLTACAAIPFGETRTYTEMAVAAGSPRAFRAAGSALGSNPIPVVVPCHRVLQSGGGLGGYGGGLPVKERLLELEGARGV